MLDNLMAALGDAMSAVATFVPQLLLFLVVLLIGWLIAKGLRAVTGKALRKVGFDRAVERGGIGKAMSGTKLDGSGLVASLVFYAILLITLQLAFNAFGPNPISTLLTQIVTFLPRIAVAIVIVVVAAAVAAAVKDLITRAMGGLSYGRVLATIAQVFIVGLGVIAALSQMGVAVAVTLPVLITVLATVGGILVVGVGGGLIGPMRQRWERMLTRAEQEAPQARAHADAFSRGREDATRQMGGTAQPGGAARVDDEALNTGPVRVSAPEDTTR